MKRIIALLAALMMLLTAACAETDAPIELTGTEEGTQLEVNAGKLKIACRVSDSTHVLTQKTTKKECAAMELSYDIV